MFAEMQSTYSSDSRCLRLTVPGLSGEFHAVCAEIHEYVNQLFRAEIEFTSFEEIHPEKLIGRNVEIEFSFSTSVSPETSARPVSRYLNGIVTQLQFQSPDTQKPRHCRIVVQPDLWRLSQSSDHRIWQHMSAVDVAGALIKEYNQSSPEFRLQTQPSVVEYSVQYGETDFEYMVRRLEEAGLFWWFHHDKGRCRFCIGDRPASWMRAQEWADGTASFFLNNRQNGREHIFSWQEAFQYVPRSRAGADWNFEMPNAAITTQVPSLIQQADSSGKGFFSYPVGVQTNEEAENRQKLLLLADEAQYCMIDGRSTVHLLAPGRMFTPAYLKGGQMPDHVIIGITHYISAAAPSSGEQNPVYHNRFTAIPANIPLIPHNKRAAPHIETTQIAVVAGPDNEQIHCDKYGRVKLWFPWDRKAKKDGSDTCWIRVAQIWGGSGWGAQIIPRVGTEVVVSFLNGNPDKPVVTGVVANPQTMPAYKLPDYKTRLTIRSQSYKAEGFNEISLEDAAGEEHFFIAAQKEKTELTGGSHMSRAAQHAINAIGGNQSHRTGGSSKTETAGSVHIAVGADGADARKVFNDLSALNRKTTELLDQGAGLSSGNGADGLKALAQALRTQKLGFWSPDGLQKQNDYLKDDGLNAGKTLAELGVELGKDINQAFQGTGEHHTIISRLRSETIGHACVDQVAGGKVLHVGGIYLNHTAQEKITTVGKKLSMLSGEATDIQSKKIEIFADNHIRLSTPGGYIELNKSGIIIHGLKIDIQGNQVDFQQGGAGTGVTKSLPDG